MTKKELQEGYENLCKRYAKRCNEIECLKEKLTQNRRTAQAIFKIGKAYGWAKGNTIIGNFSTIGAYAEQIIKS